MWRVFYPLMLPSFVGIWIWVMLHAVRSASLPLFLYEGPDNQVLAVLIWNMWDQGEIQAVGAIGVIIANNAASQPAPGLGGSDANVTLPVLSITKETADACPNFAGRVVRDLKNGPSPDWLQRRLKAVGLRPINALVDITNYISYDRARPLHVYDAKKLTGGVIEARQL